MKRCHQSQFMLYNSLNRPQLSSYAHTTPWSFYLIVSILALLYLACDEQTQSNSTLVQTDQSMAMSLDQMMPHSIDATTMDSMPDAHVMFDAMPDLTSDAFDDMHRPDMYQSQPTQMITLEDAQSQLDVAYQGGFHMSWGNLQQQYLHFDTQSVRIGWTEQRDPALNYDAYPMLATPENYVAPQGLVWTSVVDAELIESSETQLLLHLTMSQGYQVAMQLTHDATARIAIELKALPHLSDQRLPFIAFFEMNPQLQSHQNDEIYGLGEWYDQITHKGKIRVMHLALDPDLEQSYNEVHAPIPYLISSQGWGMFIASDAPTTFDVAHSDEERIKAVWSTEATLPNDEASSTTFYLFASEHPLDLHQHYYQVTGWPRSLAPWALGPWIWRDEHENQAQVESDIQLIRDLDLATSGYWIDRPYGSAVGAFDFEMQRFPDPQSMARAIRQSGLKFALWHAPYIDKDAEATADLYAESNERGFFPSQAGLLLNYWSKPIDFTQAGAMEWWQDKLSYYQQLEVVGYKLDYAEDIVVGLNGRRIPWQFADGSNELTMHNQYQRLYHQVYAETLGADGGFLMCRTARWGDQVNSNVIWPADLDADFSRFKERRVDDSGEEYGAVGGIPAALSAGLSLSASGFPFYASDTGGYRHAPPDKETFMRWVSMSALGTVMQTGTSANDVPWEFDDENGFDQEVLDTYRRYARLHMRLFPYKWTYAQTLQQQRSARPLMRPLGLAYPHLQQHPSDIYLLGDDLLIAPVIERDARNREVFFPDGIWIDWWNDTVWQGNQSHLIDSPLDHIPFFAQAGAMIPLLRPSIDTLATVEPTEEQEGDEQEGEAFNETIESFADQPGLLWVRVVGSQQISDGFQKEFTLYDGTQLTLSSRDGQITLTYQAGNVFDQGIVFIISGMDMVVDDLQLDSMSISFENEWESFQSLLVGGYFDIEGRTLYIKQESNQAVVTWSVSN